MTFPGSKACQINVSRECTEGFQHFIVMNHYFYAIYAYHVHHIDVLIYNI